jgi:DNA segregation ATPase FtsK/SpoIIIE, S-DNA-T family
LLLEILTSMIAGSVYASTKIYQGKSKNDAEKINQIVMNAGLTITEGKETKTIHLLQKRRIKQDKQIIGTEYIYRLPFGLSVKEFEKKRKIIEDGLNTKTKWLDFELKDVFKLKLNRNTLKQLRTLLMTSKRSEKEVEIEFDGTLKVKVYETPLSTKIDYTEALLKACKGWEIPVGFTRQGLIKHDFDKIYHMIIAGASGYGKSVMLKNIITTLIARKTKHVHFTLVDLKGGLAFNRFRLLEQVDGFAKTPKEALKELKEAQRRMEEMLSYLLEKGFEDVSEAGIEDRHFVIIDEAADLSEESEALEIVKDIARRGRGAGVRLIYATQYPTNESLPSQVRQNCDARICFKLQTGIASRAVLDEEGAESLPYGMYGRAIYRTDRKQVVQTPLIKNQFIDDTIKPNITFKSRKERKEVNEHQERTTPGTHSLILEETPLS